MFLSKEILALFIYKKFKYYSKNDRRNSNYKKVTDTLVRSTQEICTIELENGNIKSTTGHLFMVKDKWWKAAAELKAEEVLETADGKCQIVKSIIVEEKGYPVTTYNLSVEDNHTFFVGNEKVLTHNTINMLNKCNFTKASDYGKYPTIIDDKVKVIDKVDLPEWIGESFKDGNYRTVVTKENITFYRTYGGGAKVDGSFVTTTSAGNRINAKINTALVPEWKNSRQYEAVIEVPKGTTINIGRVDKQYTKTGALLEGDGDQILLPQGWPSEWIKEVREVPSR